MRKINLSEFMKRRHLVKIMLIVVVVLIGIVYFRMENDPRVTVKDQQSILYTAVQYYEMDNLQLPDSLDALTEQKNGKGPYVKPGELIDPWGKKFKYSKKNGLGFIISTTSPDGEVFSGGEGFDADLW
ncbi:MAG: type II secretion system protein GspG [Pontiellaceae bacterium]|jgi:hypothetical protein|nr:type II secretion system protein GspG [Pontiellaceae bacterium]